MFYEYECSECQHTFEVRHSMTEDYTAKCPKCGGECKRKFSPIPFSFGWRLSEKSHEIGTPKEAMEKAV